MPSKARKAAAAQALQSIPKDLRRRQRSSDPNAAPLLKCKLFKLGQQHRVLPSPTRQRGCIFAMLPV